MSKAKIFYFTLQDEQTKEEKLDWFGRTRFEQIPFDHITPDWKANWINLTSNDFDSFLPLADKAVKAEESEKAIFKLFSRGVTTQRDEWVIDFSDNALLRKANYLLSVYQKRLKGISEIDLDIKWDDDLTRYLERKIQKSFDKLCIKTLQYRPYNRRFLYFDKHFNARTYQWSNITRDGSINLSIAIGFGTSIFASLVSDRIIDSAILKFGNGTTQCLPLYRYDKNGNRIDNITDWGLTQFQTHYNDSTITKEAIFHYTYAVLHHPAYRQKYELNLKREFPRLPFYPDFHQWAAWGKALMDLHLNYETVEPYGLTRIDTGKQGQQVKPQQTSLFDPAPESKPPSRSTTPKAKLKADKVAGEIVLDTETTLKGVPAIAWEYKLGNRSALEWILDQYKEKKPKDPTIAALFNTYQFADYKEHVIDLLQRVCTVSVRTMEIIDQMPDTVEHQS